MHIYAFGSLCRGDVTKGSDADLLAIVDGHDSRFDPEAFSIYSYERIKELWQEGNPFAWHLALESRLLYSSDQHDFLKDLGNPAEYKNCVRDCEKFFALFREASASIVSGGNSMVFNLSTTFLSIRNLATCFSLGIGKSPDFSRSSALHLGPNRIPISQSSYQILERSRILCTRGSGADVSHAEADSVVRELDAIEKWMDSLLAEARNNGRVQ